MTDPVHNQVYDWKDNQPTGAEGWVCFVRPCNGVCGGGIFMSPTATEGETLDIAANMAKKFTVTDPQIGGAKAGIRFDPADPRAESVLKRFIIHFAPLLKNSWVTAGDLGTDDVVIERIIHEDVGLVTCQATLGRKYAEQSGQPDLSRQLAWIVTMPATPHFPMIEAAVGFGLNETIRTTVSLSEKQKDSGASSGGGNDNKKKRVILIGFGAVGRSFAWYAKEKGEFSIVAIADRNGWIQCPEGIDVEELVSSVQQKQKGAKEFFPHLTEEQSRKWNATKFQPSSSATDDQENLCRMIKAVGPAEIFTPCAGRYQITQRVVDHLMQYTWPKDQVTQRFFIAGANNPFGQIQSSGLLVERPEFYNEMWTKYGVVCVPDYVANSGTAQLFHRGLSVPFNQHQPNINTVILDACGEPIRSFLNTAIAEHGQQDGDFVKACRKLTDQRLIQPIPFAAANGATRASIDNTVRKQIQEENKRLVNRQGTTTAGANGHPKSIYALPPVPAEKLPPLEERVRLCGMVSRFGGELLEEPELVSKLEQSAKEGWAPVAYDGFEPSGRMHIAQGILKSIFVNCLTQAGFTYLFWVADWFAKLNHKMGGDLEKIRIMGQYFVEVWKVAGMDMSRVRFLWASEEFDKRGSDYWSGVLDIATANTADRITRCSQIMGRTDKGLSCSQLFYPCMQARDIFFLGVDVCQLGLDQRKVNILAREYADKKGMEKPILLHHGMLPGLKEGQEKMSKSDPTSAIYMESSREEIEQNLKKAFCPPYESDIDKYRQEEQDRRQKEKKPASAIEEVKSLSAEQLEQMQLNRNPVVCYYRAIVFPYEEQKGRLPLVLNREEKYGGNLTFHSFDEMWEAYKKNQVAPPDLKTNLANLLDSYIEPVRKHFQTDPTARALLEQITRWQTEQKDQKK